MNTMKALFSFILLALNLAACSLPGMKGSTTGATEDGIYSVEFFANAGILQGHARDETEYRDLAQGSASLSSGSFLRTLGGEAFVVLPDDSVLKMGAYTEIQVGMYENGIMIWQHSGETLHIVAPREEEIYVVATPYGTAEAQGTEYEVRVDYPAQGWVAVYWGEIGVVETEPAVVYGLVPEGVIFISPEGAREYIRLEPGDTITWDIDPATGQPRRSQNTTPPDATAQRNQEMAWRIRELMQQYWDGSITREAYHGGLNGLLNEALGLAEPEPGSEGGEDVTPVINLGGLYGGELGGQVVTFCFDGTYVGLITWTTELQCTDKVTNEQYYRWYTYSVSAIMTVGSGGDFSLIYTVDPEISKDTAISVEGIIGSGGGSITLAAQSNSDIEFCGTGFVTIPVSPMAADCISE